MSTYTNLLTFSLCLGLFLFRRVWLGIINNPKDFYNLGLALISLFLFSLGLNGSVTSAQDHFLYDWLVAGVFGFVASHYLPTFYTLVHFKQGLHLENIGLHTDHVGDYLQTRLRQTAVPLFLATVVLALILALTARCVFQWN